MSAPTEELSHLEVIGSMVAMLNQGAKGRLAEATEEQGEMYRSISGGGNDSHVTQVLFDAGAPLTNSAGVPWTAAYIDTIGDPTADLRSNIAAEARAKIVYERLMSCTPDAGVREALGFLMTREIAHQKSFEKALYAIQPNFPPGELQGDGDMRDGWNQGEQWTFVEGSDQGAAAVDGGDGAATVGLTKDENTSIRAFAARTVSDPSADPPTGAELGTDVEAGAAAAGTTKAGRKRETASGTTTPRSPTSRH